MRLANLWAIFLIPILFPFVVYWWRNRTRPIGIVYSDTRIAARTEQAWQRLIIKIQPYWRLCVIGLVVLAVLRPQAVTRLQDISHPGVDIVIAMDVSGSMLAEDFKPDNRMTAAKKVASRFIESRPNDRIGMVVFGANALTQCPITSDRPVLLELIDRIEVGMAGSGTAVGMGIATAANRLKTSNAKSKVIVLVTDGVNNAGEITPEEAARIASSLKIKVYSVGIGKEGGAPIPVIDPVLGKTYEKNPDGTVALTELDEPLLKMIAETTGGRYFRATNERVLADIYETINRLEKTPTKITYYNRYTDWFGAILWVALGMLFVEIVVTRLWLRVAP